MMKRAALLLLGLAAVVPLIAQQAPGQIRPRPAEGREPEFKPPTIREYQPKSQLVTLQHPVPRAKYPVIDIHSHQSTPISPAEYDRVMKGMEANNLQILVNLSGSFGDRLRQGVDALKASKYKDRMVLFANINFEGGVGPGFGARAAKQLFGFSSARTAISRTSTRTTGASSRPTTSTSITTATITHSGSCTALDCPIPYCARCISAMR